MPRALQVDQRVGHHLAGAVVGDLAAAVGLHDRDVAGAEQVVRLAGEALREDGGRARTTQISSEVCGPRSALLNAFIASTVDS